MKYYCCSSSKNLYENYYNDQAGNGIPVFSGKMYQRGHGLGNIFSSLVRTAVPLVKRGLQSVGKRALQTGLEVAQDVISDQPLKKSVEMRAKNAGKDLLGSVVNRLSASQDSLWSQIDVIINDVLVTNSSPYYAYRAYLEQLLSYDKNSQQTRGQLLMWHKDDAGKHDNTRLADGDRNTGLLARFNRLKNSKEVNLLGRLHLDLFNQPKYLPAGLNIKIRLVHQSDNFVLITGADGEFEVIITRAILHVCKCQLNPSLVLAHEKALLKSDAPFPINRVQMKSFAVSAGSQSITQQNVFMGAIPNRIIVGLVKNANVVGTKNLNPYNFQSFGLTQIGYT
jgi:hypothetical protein